MKGPPVNDFLQQIGDLSREQLLQLSVALHDEILQMRPEESAAAQACARLLYQTQWSSAPALQQVAATGAPKHIVVLTDAAERPARLPADAPAWRITHLPHAVAEVWSPRALGERLAALRARIGAVDAIVYCPERLCGLDQPERAFAQWTAALQLAAALAQTGTEETAALWLLTQGAQRIPGDDAPDNLWHAALNGLGKSMALECPARWGGCIDVDGSAAALEQALNEILQGDDDEVAYRGTARFLPALVRLPPPAHRFIPRAHAAYLVTGGSGGIGRVLVEHLLRRGAACVLVTSRQAAGMHDHLADWALRYPQASVQAFEADVGDAEAMAGVFAAVAARAEPLRGIFHAAGVNDLVPLTQVTPQRIDEILHAKVRGALHLHRLTQGLDLDFQLYFSSIAASWGTASMAVYAIANRFLDSLSAYRAQQGQATCSIAWGPWGEVGMIVQQRQTAFAALGLRLLRPADGLAVIDALAGGATPQVSAVDVDWRRYAQVIDRPRHLRPFRAWLDAARPSPSAAAGPAAAAIRQAAQIADFVRGLIEELLAARLPQDSGRRSLQDLGLGSLSSVELSQKISRQLGIACRSTVVFDFASLDALVADLVARWSQAHASAAPDLPAATAVNGADAVAIVGMACRLPGADSPQQLWELMEKATTSDATAIRQTPASRFDLERYSCAAGSAGKSHNLAGGYLDDIAGFDHALFGISRREADLMDPQQRLALETAWQALEQAGLDPAALAETGAGNDAGVFFGIGQNEYAALCRADLQVENVGLMPTGQSMNIIAGRIGHFFGLHGPAIAYDTACSSALVALDAALTQLRAGRSRIALVGGVNALVAPETFVLLSKAGALSRQGQCRAFDASADGYVRAEGCVVLVLKRLADARADGDSVLALIRGSAVNHDGRSSSLTAPSGRAQEQVMRAALRDAGVEADQVALIEAHGTGTALGDPIEYHALRAVYADGIARRAPLYLGTVKSFIGHTEAASGLSGVLKLVLSLQHGVVPAQANFSRINPHIDTSGSIEIPTRMQTLPALRGRRIGAVSAFGFSGTNAHVIIEQGDAVVPPPRPGRALQRVRCWYTQRPLCQSSGLAQAFAPPPAPADDAVPLRPSCYVSQWLRYDAGGVAPGAVVLLPPVAGTAAAALLHTATRQALGARGIARIEPGDAAAVTAAGTVIVLCLEPAAAHRADSVAAILDSVRAHYQAVHAACAHLTDSAAYRYGGLPHLLVLAADIGFGGAGDPHLAAVLACISKEFPVLAASVAEIDARFDLAQLPAYLDALLAAREPVLALTPAGIRRRRLQALAETAPQRPLRLAAERSVLLSGALGGIGEQLLPWLLKQGARHIVNFNRRLPSAPQAMYLQQLAERHGAQIRSLAVDVADPTAVDAAVAAVAAQMPPLGSVFHCAGVLDDAAFHDSRWDSVHAVLLPKFVGAWNLHRATENLPLDHFVLFSSLAALLGNAGQAGYALANSLMDRLAALRRARGLAALSVQWGPWAQTGMTRRDGAVLAARQRAIGLSPLPASAYLDALSLRLAAAHGTPASVALFQMDWERYLGARSTPPAHASLLGKSPDAVRAADLPAAAPLRRALEQTAAAHRARRLRDFLSAEIADCLHWAPGSAVDPHCGFAALGIDSLHASVLQQKVETAVGMPLSRSLTFDYPTLEALAGFLQANPLSALFATVVDAPADAGDDHLDDCSEDELARILAREIEQVSPEGTTE